MRKEIERLHINLYGNKREIEKVEELINQVDFSSNNEGIIRLLIQDKIESCNEELKGLTILYKGNTVYQLSKTIKALKSLKKRGLHSMNDYQYSLLMNFDIAHYDKIGFEEYYDGSFDNFIKERKHDLLNIPYWHTDLIKSIVLSGIFRPDELPYNYAKYVI